MRRLHSTRRSRRRRRRHHGQHPQRKPRNMQRLHSMRISILRRPPTTTTTATTHTATPMPQDHNAVEQWQTGDVLLPKWASATEVDAWVRLLTQRDVSRAGRVKVYEGFTETVYRYVFHIKRNTSTKRRICKTSSLSCHREKQRMMNR